MVSNEKKDTMTNRAWESLYGRLQQDKLLPEAILPKASVSSSKRLIYYISGAAVLCLVVLLLREVNSGGGLNKSQLVALYNEKSAPTLVTMLEDGSVVYLSGQTTLQYPDHFQEDKREVMLEGEAFFEISRKTEQPFLIDTKPVKIEVLGTAFNVKSKDTDSFFLSVKSGEVEVTLKSKKQAIRVKAGESVLLKSDNLHLLAVGSGSFDRHRKIMHFKDERLANVIHIINMYSDSARLEIAPGLEEKLLTFSFSDEDDLVKTAEVICMAMNLQYLEQEKTIYISMPGN